MKIANQSRIERGAMNISTGIKKSRWEKGEGLFCFVLIHVSGELYSAWTTVSII
jgi:hypothetical protein